MGFQDDYFSVGFLNKKRGFQEKEGLRKFFEVMETILIDALRSFS